ncbi:kinase/pyrophosphorylase, partial [Ligilactobacillus animalis]
MSNELHVYAISDSLGETAYAIAEAASVQFPNADFKIQRYPLIKTVSLVQ